MKTTNSWSKESGASMVAVMVAMALFAIVAVMASQSFRNIGTNSRRAEAAMSAREVESVIVQSLVNKYREFVIQNCGIDPVTHFNSFLIGNLATATSRKVQFLMVDGKTTTTTPPSQVAQDDVNRCATTPFAKYIPQKSDTFYSCYNLDINPNIRKEATHDAFASNRGSFVEAFVRLRNLQTDTLTSCDAMLQDRGFGLEIYYSLHWATPSGQATLYDSKTGSLNVAL